MELEKYLIRIFSFGVLDPKSRFYLFHKAIVINEKEFRMSLCYLVF